MQLKSHKAKLDLMDQHVEDVVNGIKSEIAQSARRDAQLVDRRPP